MDFATGNMILLRLSGQMGKYCGLLFHCEPETLMPLIFEAIGPMNNHFKIRKLCIGPGILKKIEERR